MGNKKLIASEKERETLLLDNIKESIKTKAIEQHNENLKSKNPPLKDGATKKADEVAKVITDHIIKGNEVKLLTAPVNDEEEEIEVANELREETAVVRERWKKLNKKDQQLLLDKYTLKEDENE